MGCPLDMPAQGDSCDSEGLSCPYDKCCPVYASCSGGVWNLEYTNCAIPSCPVDAPQTGEDCTCMEGQLCGWGNCADGMSTAEISAQCVANTDGTSTWQTDSKQCVAGVSCGMMTCLPGQICVSSESGIALNYACSDDPCAPNALDCTCAASLCGGNLCTVTDQQNVYCACPTCV